MIRRRGRRPLARWVAWVAWVALPAGPAGAQSLDERLDEEAFLQGLVDLELTELLTHYLDEHPPADSARAAQYRVAATALSLARIDGVSRERVELLERLLVMRADLIRRYRDHPRRAVWLAEQASDLLFELLPLEASGMTALYGLPSESQLRRAQRVAGQMNGLLVQAELEIERAILEIESRPGYREDESLRMQRRRLARDEREGRIPFLRGVAACLFAELSMEPGPERRAQYARAVETLAPLCRSLEGMPARRARLYCGLALWRLGRGDEARVLLDEVVADEATSPADVFAARMTLAGLTMTKDGPEAGLRVLDRLASDYPGAADLYFRILIADRRFLVLDELARAGRGDSRRRAMERALAVYLALLDDAGPREIDDVRAIVFDRLSRAAPPDVALEALPAIVAVARADRIADDPARRVEAIAGFESALERSDLDPHTRAIALFALGRTFRRTGRPLEAARRFAQLAREQPKDAAAPRAIQLAASLLWEQHRTSLGDPEVLDALQDTLALLLDEFPDLPDAQQWRYLAGRALMEAGEPETAIVHFEAIPRTAPQWMDARYMAVAALRIAATRASDPARGRELGRRLATAATTTRDTLVDGAGTLGTDREYDRLFYLAQLRVFAAEAAVMQGEPSAAIEMLRDVEDEPGIDTATLAAALHVRIEAFQTLGRPDEARRELDGFMRAAPDEVGSVLGSMLGAALRGVTELQADDRPDEALEKGRRDAAPLADRLESWIESRRLDAEERSALLNRVAAAYRLSGRYEDGLRVYRELGRLNPNALEILFGRAECLFGLGDGHYEEAIAIYKRVAAAGPGVGHDYYWQSQLRMLHILDRVQRSTRQIVPRIERLRIQDPALGGDRYRRQFERLANKYA